MCETRIRVRERARCRKGSAERDQQDGSAENSEEGCEAMGVQGRLAALSAAASVLLPLDS